MRRPPTLPPDVRELALQAKGFLQAAEGQALFELAAASSPLAPCLEVGCYCGKSSLFLAAGCREAGGYPLFCIDHHRGSAEQQPGQEYFDPDLFDADSGRVDTLREFRRNLSRAGLESWVIPVVHESAFIARLWPGLGLGLVFVDGGHGEADVESDFASWLPKILPGGYLCVHDLFADPRDGGQAPYRAFERVRAGGGWEHLGQVETLGILRRQC
ncbi:MAG: class I SAM-dependent methyltransferase [Thermoanaerobaculia bacterium]